MNEELVTRPKEREIFLCEIKLPPEMAAYFEQLTTQLFKDLAERFDREKHGQQPES